MNFSFPPSFEMPLLNPLPSQIRRDSWDPPQYTPSPDPRSNNCSISFEFSRERQLPSIECTRMNHPPYGTGNGNQSQWMMSNPPYQNLMSHMPPVNGYWNVGYEASNVPRTNSFSARDWRSCPPLPHPTHRQEWIELRCGSNMGYSVSPTNNLWTGQMYNGGNPSDWRENFPPEFAKRTSEVPAKELSEEDAQELAEIQAEQLFRFFGFRELVKYTGRRDHRNPIIFLEEFEGATELFEDYEVVRAYIFIYSFHPEQYEAAKAFRADMGYSWLKDYFLSLQRNESDRRVSSPPSLPEETSKLPKMLFELLLLIFDPSQIVKYIGKRDRRSPVAFIKEFERRTFFIAGDEFLRGRLFICSFDREKYIAVNAFSPKWGYLRLKNYFLSWSWNELVCERVMEEIRDAVYDPNQFETEGDFLISLYSTLDECRLSANAIYSKLFPKLPVAFQTQMKLKHFATFTEFVATVSRIQNMR